ncbi:septal ring lytic transglycosylase RlpA family protein [Caballeronia sp. LZ001]|uniref:septal ring lytic transglycosylase RlpA family protein n=1 Tax=Caballeronia sp. LZ001 TaxID=3038553 RepID=UPI00285C7389|nr:septal ring lytic transglycosylase RlpA family protein [Caballeronia sp. LZ001]MDR5805780.1 septal ring lytic transglycosylase RlpA family protein [Caballeronia sp. LZ001]
MRLRTMGNDTLSTIHLKERAQSGSKIRALVFVTLTCWLNAAFPAAQEKTQTQTHTHAHKRAQKHARHSQANVNATAKAAAAEPVNLDRSGKERKGKASYYGRNFYTKKMADGTPMNPQSNSAASKTLPLGTKARVTNLENGNSDVVEIRDRGPYVKDRIVDVSPKTADKLGLKENGTAPVEVKPVEVPQADGTVKPGAGATSSN